MGHETKLCGDQMNIETIQTPEEVLTSNFTVQQPLTAQPV